MNPEADDTNGYKRLQSLLSFRCAGLAPLDAMQRYRDFEESSERCRLATRSDFGNWVESWNVGFWLMTELFGLFEPAVLPEADPEDFTQISEYESRFYRLSVLGLAVRTSKVALDLCLDGYYSQAFALCRTMYETAKRCLYTRQRPTDVYRFMDPSTILEEAKSHPSYSRKSDNLGGHEWKAFSKELERSDGGDQASVEVKLLNGIHSRMLYLNRHAHPDMEGVTDLMERTPEGLQLQYQFLRPEYSRLHASESLRIGITAIVVLTWELRHLLPVTELLRSDIEAWLSESLRLVQT